MKYLIIAEWYEQYEGSDRIILGACKKKKQAKAIVKRLTKEDETKEYEYSYELITKYIYTGEYKTVVEPYVEPVFDLTTPKGRMQKSMHEITRKTVPIDTGNLGVDFVGTNKAGFILKNSGTVAPYLKILEEADREFSYLTDSITLKKVLNVGDYEIRDGVKWFVTKATPELEFTSGIGIMVMKYEWQKENGEN